jgi:hypothetical protein
MPAGVSAITALANLTLGSSQAAVTFSSISTSFRDLRVVITGTSNSGAFFRINGEGSGGPYSLVTMESNSASLFSTSTASNTANVVWNTAGFNVGGVGCWNLDFFDYAQTNKQKPILSRFSIMSGASNTFYYRYSNTVAITSIEFNSGGSWAAGTTFTLYGVSA